MIKIQKLKSLVLLCALFFLFSAPLVFAAEMFFVAPDNKPAVGDLFKTDFFLNTQDQNINAVTGKVIFPGDTLELKEIRDGNSIINLWVDRPALKADGQIAFSGITPGGYKGDKGLLFSLIFRVVKSGPASLKVSEGQTLLNDGKGTEVNLFAPTLILQTVAKSEGGQVNYDLNDKTPPESFVPEIAQDKNIADDKWFVVFVTQDKESGVDHYEVQENKNNNSSGSWQTATSPYVLQDQSLRSYVYIKAVDKAGNETLAVIDPKKPPFSYGKLVIYGILLLVVLLGILRPVVWRKKGG